MAECDKLADCPFFNDKMDNMTLLSNMCRTKYCKGEFELCARWLVAASLGRERVPLTLFPHQIDKAKSIIEKG